MMDTVPIPSQVDMEIRHCCVAGRTLDKESHSRMGPSDFSSSLVHLAPEKLPEQWPKLSRGREKKVGYLLPEAHEMDPSSLS